METIFKAYDIRGIYGQTLTDETMLRIGRAFATLTKCRNVVVGRDMRTHSEPLFRALTRGLHLHGVNVVDLGMCSTPMCYFANGFLQADAGIMITASHNTAEWNGAKLSLAQAVPISADTGIRAMGDMVENGTFDPPARRPGTTSRRDVMSEYRRHVRKLSDIRRPIRIAADMANAMGIRESEALDGLVEIDPMFGQYDGTFPHHEANPLAAETLVFLQNKVRGGTYDFGIAFDGDADRVGFVDERGEIVPMDIVTALIAEDLLEKEKGVILYDLRSSWTVREAIERGGGIPVMSRVGHAFIKTQMRDHNAVFAGERSGHYYFRDNYFAESTSMAVICVAGIVSRSRAPLSARVAPLRRYFASGEIDSSVEDKDAVVRRINATYPGGRRTSLDGVTVEYDDWWFNVRESNTESSGGKSVVRLNVEAKRRDVMEAKRDELVALIRA
jgi:phosphomannomutase